MSVLQITSAFTRTCHVFSVFRLGRALWPLFGVISSNRLGGVVAALGLGGKWRGPLVCSLSGALTYVYIYVYSFNCMHCIILIILNIAFIYFSFY